MTKRQCQYLVKRNPKANFFMLMELKRIKEEEEKRDNLWLERQYVERIVDRHRMDYQEDLFLFRR